MLVGSIDRFARCPWGTYGHLVLITGFEAYTVERPWLDNKPWVSCIPPGEYQIRKGTFIAADYPCYELVDVPERSRILIHVANVPSELSGCIGLGRAPFWYKDQWGLSDSTDTHLQFMRAMNAFDAEERLELRIRWRLAG